MVLSVSDDQDTVWVEVSGGPNEALDGGPDPPCEGAIIRGMLPIKGV